MKVSAKFRRSAPQGPKAGFWGSIIASGLGGWLSSKNASGARKKNEALLNEIRQLFADTNTSAFGGEQVVQEGQEKPLSKSEWWKANVSGDAVTGTDEWNKAEAAYAQYVKDFVPSDRVTKNVTGDFDKMLQALSSRMGIASEGFDQARSQLGRTADASRTQAHDLSQQAMGGATQRAIASGRYNTSFLDNAQRGIAADTSRRLQEIDSRLAGMQADLTNRETGVMTGLVGDVANFYGQKASFGAQQNQSLASLLSNTTYTANPVNLGGFGQGLNDLFASFGQKDTRPNPYGADPNVYGPL